MRPIRFDKEQQEQGDGEDRHQDAKGNVCVDLAEEFPAQAGLCVSAAFLAQDIVDEQQQVEQQGREDREGSDERVDGVQVEGEMQEEGQEQRRPHSGT